MARNNNNRLLENPANAAILESYVKAEYARMSHVLSPMLGVWSTAQQAFLQEITTATSGRSRSELAATAIGGIGGYIEKIKSNRMLLKPLKIFPGEKGRCAKALDGMIDSLLDEYNTCSAWTAYFASNLVEAAKKMSHATGIPHEVLVSDQRYLSELMRTAVPERSDAISVLNAWYNFASKALSIAPELVRLMRLTGKTGSRFAEIEKSLPSSKGIDRMKFDFYDYKLQEIDRIYNHFGIQHPAAEEKRRELRDDLITAEEVSTGPQERPRSILDDLF